jgi:hypothetical protein
MNFASAVISSFSHERVSPWKYEVENIRPGGAEADRGPPRKAGTSP